MKYLIVLMSLLSMSAYAEMPKYLKGATVTVTLKNGKTYTFKSEEHAVVPRNQMTKPTEIKMARKIIKQVEQKKLVKNKKNRVYILGGVGNTGSLETSTNGSTYETKNKRGVVGGVGYQRKINQDVNVGVQVQTNGTTSLSIGTDF